MLQLFAGLGGFSNSLSFVFFIFFWCLIHVDKRRASTSATFEMLYEQGEFMSSTNAPIRSLDP